MNSFEYWRKGQPKLLDLCCHAGGAADGYHRAGFDVTGVDVVPQPRYPFRFILADALTVPLDGYDAYHASPPCLAHTAYKRRKGVAVGAACIIGPVRERLKATGKPYVIENVPGAPLLSPVTLCGSMFGLDVRRHRCFESNVPLHQPPCDHSAWTPRFPPATNRRNLRKTVEVGAYRIPLAVQKDAMGGCEWMTLPELSQALPPAYTRYLGAQVLAHMRVRSL